jgi:hypothetical protein
VANEAAAGRLLEGRLAGAAARAGVLRSLDVGGEEHVALAARLQREADQLSMLGVDQAVVLSGAERVAALTPVLRAGQVLDDELETMLEISALGLRAAISDTTAAAYTARMAALDRRIGTD